MSVPLADLVAYLDDLLETDEVPDYPGAHNGLQVEREGPVQRVVTAVDACQASIDHAVDTNADLLIVHHGLFWDGAVPLTGRRWRRVRSLLRQNVGLYSSHLPLDRHPGLGNNALLAAALGLAEVESFGRYHGVEIGRVGRWEGSRDNLAARVAAVTGVPPRVIGTGPDAVQRVGIVSGGGGSMIGEASEAGIDTLLTGEGSHHTYFDAEEWEVNVVYAGHYATETFGVRALGEHVAERFDLHASFFDHPTGL